MNECQKRGHRKIKMICEECGQEVNRAEFEAPDKIECKGNPLPASNEMKIFAPEGYETFPMQNNIIGIRRKWISVKEKLPQIFERGPNSNASSDKVLVTDGNEIQVGIRWICGKDEHFFPDCREEFGKITHWMPLPEPPKEPPK